MTAPTKPEPPTENFARPSYFTTTSKAATAERAEREAAETRERHVLPPTPQIVHVDVDDQRPGWFARFATWLGRTIYLLIFVAAVGAAAAAAMHAWDLRDQRDEDAARISALERQVTSVTAARDEATTELTEAQTTIAKLEAEVDAADTRASDAETAADAYRSALVSEQARAGS